MIEPGSLEHHVLDAFANGEAGSQEELLQTLRARPERGRAADRRRLCCALRAWPHRARSAALSDARPRDVLEDVALDDP
jgi:hypothetical protein